MSDTTSEIAEQRYTRKVLEAVIRIGLLVLLALWSFQIFSPFLGPVVWGMIIAIAVHRIFHGLETAVGGRSGLAATIFVLLALVILITPTVMLSESLMTSAQGFSEQLEAGTVKVPPPSERVADIPIIGEQIYKTWGAASRNLESAIDDFAPQIKTFSAWLLSRALGAGVEILLFALSIIIAAIFLANAQACTNLARAIFVRLAGERGTNLIDLGRDTILSVARGVLGIAVIQTFFLAIGLIVAGVPAAGVLSVVVLLFAVAQIPMLLLFLPIIAYVFSTADTTIAIPFAIWSVFFSFADGFLKPLLLGRGLEVPMPVILVGVIGGMLTSGIIGLFVGPVVLAFSYKLFLIWLGQEPAQLEDSSPG